MEIEEWKFIEGYEGRYEVSNLGQIKSIGRLGGYTGISWNKKRNKYSVMIKVRQESIFGGRFTHLEDAIKRRDELKQQYHTIGVNSK